MKSKQNKSQLVQQMLNQSIAIGRFWAWFKFILLLLLALILLVLGIILLSMKKDKHTAGTVANISTSQCIIRGTDDKGNKEYDCKVILVYTVENVSYEIPYTIENTTTRYDVGDTINIKYNPEDPKDIDIDPINLKVAGGILIGLSILILIIAPAMLWFTLRYKVASAASGASALYKFLK